MCKSKIFCSSTLEGGFLSVTYTQTFVLYRYMDTKISVSSWLYKCIYIYIHVYCIYIYVIHLFWIQLRDLCCPPFSPF